MSWFEMQENWRHNTVIWELHHPIECLAILSVLVVVAFTLAYMLAWLVD